MKYHNKSLPKHVPIAGRKIKYEKLFPIRVISIYHKGAKYKIEIKKNIADSKSNIFIYYNGFLLDTKNILYRTENEDVLYISKTMIDKFFESLRTKMWSCYYNAICLTNRQTNKSWKLH